MSGRLYSNENVPLGLVLKLRELGYDVLTTHEALQANRRVPDEEVLTFATGRFDVQPTRLSEAAPSNERRTRRDRLLQGRPRPRGTRCPDRHGN